MTKATKTRSDPLRIGFIGGAHNSAVGYTHFVATHMDGQMRLEAGCFSRHAAINSEAAALYGVEKSRVYPEWSKFLEAEREALDAVVVLTPTPSHRQIVVEALEAGLPTICEKALVGSSQDCHAVRHALENRGGFLAVTFNYSGYPMVRELRRRVSLGELGTIQQIHIEMPQEGFLRVGPDEKPIIPQAWRLQDGVVPTVSLDLGVHVHHLIEFVSGNAKPVEVAAQSTTFGNFKDIVDNVLGVCRLDNDVHVQFWFGKTALGYRNGLRMRVFGTRGSAEWYQMNPEELACADAQGRRFTIDRGSAGLHEAGRTRYSRFKAGHPAGFVEAFANLYHDIAIAIRGHVHGSQCDDLPVFGVEHAYRGLRFLEAIDSASRDRTWKKI